MRHPEDGAAAVDMEVTGVGAGRPIVFTTFIQPAALRLESATARQGDEPLAVEIQNDERGFARLVVPAPARAGTLRLRYVVRPGALEEGKMSGPTGYRFGHFDRSFALLGGRQVFILPMEPAPPARIEARVLVREGWTLAGSAGAGFDVSGPDAAARVVQATIGAGDFESIAAGSLRVHLLKILPAEERRLAAGRSEAIDRYLSALLGPWPAGRTFDLILVPRTPDGMLVSVAPGPDSFGLSLGRGVPTRWLSIARAVARSRLDEGGEDGAKPERHRFVRESLPAFLAIELSEQEGWRPRQAWLEQFYYNAAGLALDLEKPGDLGDASDPLMREWRGALVLDRLSRDLAEAGHATIEDRLREIVRRGDRLDPARLIDDLPAPARARLGQWLAPSPRSVPFPGTTGREAVSRMRAPARLAGAERRIDLYLGGRNLGLLEQCGCRSLQAGGLARRAALLRARRLRPTPSLAFELGDAVPFDQESPIADPQKIAESDLAFDLMAHAGEIASIVSHAELHYGPDYLAARAARLPRRFGLLTSNVSVPGLNLPNLVEVSAGGVAARLAGVEDVRAYNLGRALEFEDAIAGVRIEDPAAALRRVLPARPAPGLDVVAGSISPSTVLDIHGALPDLDLIVTDDYFHFTQDPRLEFERPLGDSAATFGYLGATLLVLLRTDTFALARLGLGVDARGRIRAAELEDLILDESVPDDPQARARLDAHYARFAASSGLAEPAPIGARQRNVIGAAYVGAPACGSCHADETRQWSATAHASAFATILGKRRQGVPGCEACHVTGYRQPTGYGSLADRPLRHVQCESCHGPGSKHAADPRRDNITRTPTAAVCQECHVEKHSDMTEENFAEYWSKVVHAR